MCQAVADRVAPAITDGRSQSLLPREGTSSVFRQRVTTLWRQRRQRRATGTRQAAEAAGWNGDAETAGGCQVAPATGQLDEHRAVRLSRRRQETQVFQLPAISQDGPGVGSNTQWKAIAIEI